MIPMFATEAHANGATWTDIATALGTSPEQAELRYSPDSPVADCRWPYGHTSNQAEPNQHRVTNQPAEGSKFRCRQRVRIQMPLTRAAGSTGIPLRLSICSA